MPLIRHSDALAHHDPDRHPTDGPLGVLYEAVYLLFFFLLAPAATIALLGCLINLWLVPGAICLAATLLFGAIAREAWRRMP